MATFGQGVNASLGKTDYSNYLVGALQGARGVAAGGSAIGQGIANLGEQVGVGIEAYAKKKQEDKELSASNKVNSGILELFGQSDALTTKQKLEVDSMMLSYAQLDGARERNTFLKNALSGVANMAELGEKTANAESLRLLQAAQANRLNNPYNVSPLEQRVKFYVDQGYSMKEAIKAAQTKGTNVNINTDSSGNPFGDAPKGMAWARNKDGTVVTETDENTGYQAPVAVSVRGGPTDVAANEAKRKTADRQQAKALAAMTVTQDFGRAITLSDNLISGDNIIGANARIASSMIPGTNEYNIMQFVESGLSNVGLDRLQMMRETSPTGGALGQVPFQQQQRLEQTLGSVKIGQSPKTFKDNMKRIFNIYTDIQHGSKEERAKLVKEGFMSKKQSEEIDSMYYDISFDSAGREKETPPGTLDPVPQEVRIDLKTGKRYRLINGKPTEIQ